MNSVFIVLQRSKYDKNFGDICYVCFTKAAAKKKKEKIETRWSKHYQEKDTLGIYFEIEELEVDDEE